MNPNQAEVRVVDQDGTCGVMDVRELHDPDARQVTARLDDGRTIVIPKPVLVAQSDGTYCLPFSLAGVQGQLDERGGQVVVPVVEERLHVEREAVEQGRVRITKEVHERDVPVDQPILREEVEVERVPVNEYVDGPRDMYYDGEVLVIPLVEEVLVVEKRLVLREELRITKRVGEVRQPQVVTLRREEARVERVDVDPAAR